MFGYMARRRGGVGPFVDYAVRRAGPLITLPWHGGEGDDAAAQGRLQPRGSRCHGRTVKAAAQMGTHIASTPQPASHGAIQEVAQRLAVLLGPAQHHGMRGQAANAATSCNRMP